ncbi:hypothetical protein Y032_0036g3189 [Ancylostoma ceylanicum]|uniref:Uncharacterized protein n=1 Tax=Ancylostoma ceylanicum TaxID=53326 RepID=A0A016UJH9_9BILA|nr:hypothetical protein Y032_0036g3189 [Ancylostoma ceylanicum]
MEKRAWPCDSDWHIRAARPPICLKLYGVDSVIKVHFCMPLYEFEQVGVTGGLNTPIRVVWSHPFSLTTTHTEKKEKKLNIEGQMEKNRKSHNKIVLDYEDIAAEIVSHGGHERAFVHDQSTSDQNNYATTIFTNFYSRSDHCKILRWVPYRLPEKSVNS